jgi:hypothetical protein
MAQTANTADWRGAENRYEGSLCAGHLLVWTWRKFVIGHADCPVLVREYLDFAGDQADDLLVTFAAFLQALGGGSRRMLSVGHPHGAGLTPDETQMLRLIAAAQTHDTHLLDANLRWMVKADQQAAALSAVMALAAQLTACGVLLPVAHYDPPPSSARLEVVRPGVSVSQAS